MAKRVNFKGEKRRKELARLKKQEEKRQKRQTGGKNDAEPVTNPEAGSETEETDTTESQEVSSES